MSHFIHNVETGEVTEVDDLPARPGAQQQFAWETLRQLRNDLLAASDWTVLSDTPTSTAAWKAYRQELRDLPANTTDPFNPVWPTPPA